MRIRRFSQRAVALILISFLLLLALPASAAANTVYALRDTALCASPGGQKIGTFYRNGIAEKLGEKSGWDLIAYNGLFGYVRSGDIGVYIDANVYTANAAATVYRTPDANADRLGTLKKGETLRVMNTTGDWTQILYGSAYGYVKNQYVAASDPSAAISSAASSPRSGSSSSSSSSTSSASSAAQSTWSNKLGRVFALVDTDVKKEANVESKAITQLLANEGADYVSESGKFTEVLLANDTKGFVRTADLVKITGPGGAVMVNAYGWRYPVRVGVNAYAIPEESARYTTGTFDMDEAIWTLADNGYWSLVYVEGKTYYVPNADLARSSSRGLRRGSTGTYKAGTVLTVGDAGADTYGTTELHPYIVPGTEKAFGKLKKGTTLIAMYTFESLVFVYWEEVPKKTGPIKRHMAYVPLIAVTG